MVVEVDALVAAVEEVEVGAEGLDLVGGLDRHRVTEALQDDGAVNGEFLRVGEGRGRGDGGLFDIGAHGEQLAGGGGIAGEGEQQEQVAVEVGGAAVGAGRFLLDPLRRIGGGDPGHALQRLPGQGGAGLVQAGGGEVRARAFDSAAELRQRGRGLGDAAAAGEEGRDLIEKGRGHGLSAPPPWRGRACVSRRR